MFLPPRILKLRINTSIKHFYEDLKLFCQTMKWECDEPVQGQTNEISWTNNLVVFKEKSQYRDNVPKEIQITYKIPSFIGSPGQNSKTFETKQLPQIGYIHTLALTLSPRYPADVAKTHIQGVTPLWHNNFGFGKGRSHACVLISGEIDGMAMNLFQQLLWNPEFVWNSAHGKHFTLNPEAQQYGKDNGLDFPHRAIKHLMDENFGKKK